MESKIEDALTCLICLEHYNSKSHLPISLSCGHTYCRSCLLSIHQSKGQINCPSDRKPEPVPFGQLSTNYSLLSLIEVLRGNSDSLHLELSDPEENIEPELQTPAVTLKFAVENHHHPLVVSNSTRNWFCDGRNLRGGCPSNSFRGTSNFSFDRFRCDSCDFDLCFKCLSKDCVTVKVTEAPCIKVSVHHHPLELSFRDVPWLCDGRKLPGGCKSGFTSSSTTQFHERWRCNSCDFDLCRSCLKHYKEEPQIPSMSLYNKTMSACHHHSLERHSEKTNWVCDGFAHEGRCKADLFERGHTDMTYWGCRQCNFDVCLACLIQYEYGVEFVKSYQTTIHPHKLLKTSRNTSWRCDGHNLNENCISGSSCERFRCGACDFDLCSNCISLFNSTHEQ